MRFLVYWHFLQLRFRTCLVRAPSVREPDQLHGPALDLCSVVCASTLSQVGFQPAWTQGPHFSALDTIVNVAFWCDFFLNFITGYMDKWGSLVTDKR